MQTSQHIFLLGFMGSGKSYWGRILAQKRNIPFYDLDELIVSNTGRSIPIIFSELGESGFRILEREALHSTLHLPAGILATGGGTPCFFDNMDWMNAQGTTIFLKTAPTLLAERLAQEKEIRPLLSAVKNEDLSSFIEQKLEARKPFYLQSRHILAQNTSNAAFLEALERILEEEI
jgi:shikimate kinase